MGDELTFAKVTTLGQGAHRASALVAAFAALFATTAAFCGSEYAFNDRSNDRCCHLVCSSVC